MKNLPLRLKNNRFLRQKMEILLSLNGLKLSLMFFLFSQDMKMLLFSRIFKDKIVKISKYIRTKKLGLFLKLGYFQIILSQDKMIMTKVKKINAITVRTRTDNSMKMLASSSDYILNMLHLKIITTPVISMRFSATGELTRLSNSKMFKPLITKRSISIASILFKKKNKYLVN